MEKLAITLILFVGGLSIATAQGSTAQESSTMIVTPAPTATPTPTTTPAPTATPAPEEPTKRFSVQNSKGESCVVLEAAMVMFVNTPKYQGDISLTEDGELDSESHCDASVPSASLVIDVKKDQFHAEVDFEFTGSATGSQYWTMNNVTVSLNDESGWINFTASNKLYQEANSKIEWGKSFSCTGSQNLTFNEVANSTLLLGVSKLKVQAFHFKNATSGEFDDARDCILDTGDRGNKIVPIAVGAALAGLVVVVLIAYLIGRLRSRRQSSYEALS